MAEKSTSKTQLILDYLTKHPDHTWKDAQKDLGKHAISAAYFAVIKGKQKKKLSPKRKPTSSAAAGTNMEPGLEQALRFARSVGDIDEAIKLLEKIRKLQV